MDILYVLIAIKRNDHLRVSLSKIRGSKELAHRLKDHFTKLSERLEINSGFGTM